MGIQLKNPLTVPYRLQYVNFISLIVLEVSQLCYTTEIRCSLKECLMLFILCCLLILLHFKNKMSCRISRWTVILL